MALSHEWEALFGTAKPAGQMQLASADPAGGSDEPDLKADEAPWTTAGGLAGQLHTRTRTALTDLDLAHEGVASRLEGFTIGATLTEVREGWEKRLGSVRDECSRLDGALKAVGKDFGEIDTEVKRSFQRLAPRPPEDGR